MKLKHMILLIMSLIYFNGMMADTSYSPIEIRDVKYDYSIEYDSSLKRYTAKGEFSINFYVNIIAARYDMEICWPPYNHSIRHILSREPTSGYCHLHLNDIFDFCKLTVLFFSKDTHTLLRLDDYPIYVRDYLSPEDYKLIYGGAGVEGISEDVEDVSIIQASDAVTIKPGNSDLQEVRVCDMTGKSILAVPASGNSSEISIDRTRLAKGLNILSVFRQDSPTKSFKILN